MVIGGSALKAIVGQKVVPGLVDRFLAKTGYSSQQTDVTAEDGHPDNLYDPVPGDRGAHGRFDDRSKTWSPQLTARMHPLAITSAASVAAVGIAGWAIVRRRS
jgi:hypothetical protein